MVYHSQIFTSKGCVWYTIVRYSHQRVVYGIPYSDIHIKGLGMVYHSQIFTSKGCVWYTIVRYSHQRAGYGIP